VHTVIHALRKYFHKNLNWEGGGGGASYRGADKSPTRMETSSEACQGCTWFQQHRDARCHQVFFLHGKAPKEIHTILTETLAYFLPGWAMDLSAPLHIWVNTVMSTSNTNDLYMHSHPISLATSKLQTLKQTSSVPLPEQRWQACIISYSSCNQQLFSLLEFLSITAAWFLPFPEVQWLSTIRTNNVNL